MDRYQYLILLGLCLLVTLPLELVFRARVYRRPRLLVRALLPALVLFVVWDVVAIAAGNWSYSETYTTGWLVPPNLPIEELLFFLVIPICALLTFEAVGNLLGGELRRPRRARSDADTDSDTDTDAAAGTPDGPARDR